HHHFRFIHLPITTTASPAHLPAHHHHHHQPSIHQNNTTAKSFSLSPSLLLPEQSHTASTHPSSPLTLSILSLPHEVSVAIIVDRIATTILATVSIESLSLCLSNHSFDGEDVGSSNVDLNKEQGPYIFVSTSRHEYKVVEEKLGSIQSRSIK
ncbi:unnamed protein product, partial [Linum tenue]